MNLSLSPELEEIREAVSKLCAQFDDEYWLAKASAVHMNIFGLNPVVVFGTQEQKQRMLPPLVQGKEKACFAVTEPDTGLNTTQLKTKAERHGDHYVMNGLKTW